LVNNSSDVYPLLKRNSLVIPAATRSLKRLIVLVKTQNVVVNDVLRRVPVL